MGDPTLIRLDAAAHLREVVMGQAERVAVLEGGNVAVCRDIARALGSVGDMLTEAISAAHSYPDHEALLGESLEAVALASGRHFHPTADQHGVDAAAAVLGDMAPALGALAEPKDYLSAILQALRDTACEYQPRHPEETPRHQWKPTEDEPEWPGYRLPVQRAQRVPIPGEVVTIDGARWVASIPEHDGMSSVVPLHWPHGQDPVTRRRRAARTKLRGDEYGEEW